MKPWCMHCLLPCFPPRCCLHHISSSRRLWRNSRLDEILTRQSEAVKCIRDYASLEQLPHIFPPQTEFDQSFYLSFDVSSPSHPPLSIFQSELVLPSLLPPTGSWLSLLSSRELSGSPWQHGTNAHPWILFSAHGTVSMQEALKLLVMNSDWRVKSTDGGMLCPAAPCQPQARVVIPNWI